MTVLKSDIYRDDNNPLHPFTWGYAVCQPCPKIDKQVEMLKEIWDASSQTIPWTAFVVNAPMGPFL